MTTDTKILDRLAKILNLAAKAGTQGEAEAALAQAQRIMAEHNLTREAVAAHEQAAAAESFAKAPRRVAKTVPFECAIAAGLVGRFWNVTPIRVIDAQGSRLEFFGRETDAAVAAYVYDFLLGAFRRAWKEHKARTGAPDRDRKSFLHGASTALREKLQAEHAQGEAQRQQAAETRGLVLVDEAAARRAAFALAYPRSRTPRSRSIGVTQGAMDAGAEAGRRMSVNAGVGAGGGGRRLLAQ